MSAPMWWILISSLLITVVQVACAPIAAGQTLRLQGGPVVLELDPVVMPVGFDTSSRLRWNRVTGPSKIMVSSFSTEQRFDLFVEAREIARGVSTGEIQLVSGSPAQDLVVGIEGRRPGRCTLGYRAETRAELGYGMQTQTVTYTITSL